MKVSVLKLVPIFALTTCALAQEQAKADSATASSEEHAGILPIPDYSGNLWDRRYLSGDWGGVRSDLANKGVQIILDWNQYAQRIVDGGRDITAEYGGKGNYQVNLDLMRMGVLPGALVRFRAESRYGKSVNKAAGPILSANTSALFPLTKLDDDIPFTITDLNYIQFLSTHFGVLAGKVNTLESDPNEFASGRGDSQFMNANFIFNPAGALRIPYSTLGAGAIWLPVLPGPKGSIFVSSTVINTADASTTTGFNDFDKGQTWVTEAHFQYLLGHLPGGFNVGGLWSFNQHFHQLNTRLVFERGEGLSVPSKHSTWAGFASAWQYLFTKGTNNAPIDITDGEADREGLGLFGRFGFTDEDTNPLELVFSGGLGGRGLIPTRENDTFGIGYYYNKLQDLRLISGRGVRDSAQGFEAYYSFAVTRAFHLTMDVQVVEPIFRGVDTATILGMRASIAF